MTTAAPQLIQATLAQLNKVILGKEQPVRLALTCLLANGHLLLEDLPGMGKTTLAHALAQVCGLEYKRVQFTSDLLPADLIGASVFESQSSSFRFHPGPVFSQLFLADELNRATPKAQSALLEAMEEGQVSVDGTTHRLPSPFFVIATQNPQSQSGTFPLPESQLDRFLLRVSLGYPGPQVERELLKGRNGRQALANLPQVLNGQRLKALQSLVPQVKLSDNLLDYIQRLIAHTRQSDVCHLGLSPRGAQALVKSAQSWALLQGRGHVLPEDVQAVFVAVAGHRLVGREETQGEQLARHILDKVDVIGSGHG
ncbi:MAG TPA: MoxR family ATPase [Candidatus Thiothrix moscowensis]|uniref:AAA family ATPase n=1 Tax=unclassified Thiothrix TaxID=2636184 RepID=UPI0025F58279|nr:MULTISPECIES: MoxR family ATPase [unclassified Thiothrix]HRJ51459.1 MoxR family ATPase [Candidatus Thiothrix moscowensis]HRJ91486.1 MoxR family ATPase [Candidatus Thiothrix moscowensis]